MNIITKNVFCKKENKRIQWFATKEDSDNFILNIQDNTGENTLRSVYCPLCAGWHLTDQPVAENSDANTQVNVLFNLEKLINELKTSFDHEYWYVWKPSLDEASTWVDLLAEDDSLSEFMVEAKRQLVHYHTIVTNAAKKNQRKTGIVRNRLKKELADLQQSINKLNIHACTASAERILVQIQEPWFQAMATEEQQYWNLLYDTLAEEEVMGILTQVAEMLKTVRVGISILPTEQLMVLHDKLMKKITFGEDRQIHPVILNPLKKEIDNISRQIKFRGTDYKDPKTGQDRVVVTLRKQCEYCNRKLSEVETALEEKDTMEALHILQTVDEHIRNIPLCKEKITIMNRIVTLSQQCV